jgi:hypothetical protein
VGSNSSGPGGFGCGLLNPALVIQARSLN